MKKLVTVFVCICMCFALWGCESNSTSSSLKPSVANIDTHSDDYQAGFEAGEKSVKENPEDYGLISEGNAKEYVEDQIDPDDAVDVQDIVDEYAENYGYHK